MYYSMDIFFLSTDYFISSQECWCQSKFLCLNFVSAEFGLGTLQHSQFRVLGHAEQDFVP